ncbi:MAG: histidinol-phosphate transaminase [Kiritimatiellia bacterium]|jgi:histidinol-phosphate aminotransferase
MKKVAKQWLQQLGVYEPGRPIDEVARELGLPDASSIVKLASNENPLGPSPKAVAALRSAADRLHYYPDGGAFYLRQALARKLGVTPEQLIVANGSNELLEFIGHVFLEPGDEIVMAEFAFVTYRLIAGMFQAKVTSVPMKDYTHDLDAMLRAITPRTKVVFISNPNNPTSTIVQKADLDSFIESLPPHVVACIDEAYFDLLQPEYRPDSLRYIREGRRVILLRTFSKSYGLAGLRVGYGVSTAEGIRLMHQIRQPFNINSLALEAALAALDDDEHVQRFQELLRTELPFMTAGLDRLDLSYVPPTVNFIMVDVGDGREVFQAMQREHVIVRPLNGYQLPQYVRITVGTRPENEKCLQALEKAIRRK